MKTKVNLKKGVSLIVLVITIIVMIILAAAIILALSNSGIISKANKAKTDSDTASLREYVNTLKAEYELKSKVEQMEVETLAEYVNTRLKEKGYNVEVTEDGILMNEAATAAVKAGIKIGDVITNYTVAETTYTTDGSERSVTGSTDSQKEQTIATNTNIIWKYMGVNANGELEIMADFGEKDSAANTKITLTGKGGYLNGPRVLNEVCEKLYSVDCVGTARSMNMDDVNKVLGYKGGKGAYQRTEEGKYTLTKEAMTIGEIIDKKGEKTLSSTKTPDGRDINTYKSNYYYIGKAGNAWEMENAENIKLIYNDNNVYWLADVCAYACFNTGNVKFRCT